MVTVTANTNAVRRSIVRLQGGLVPALVKRLAGLDYALVAAAALAANVRGAEADFVPEILAGLAVRPMPLGFGIHVGVPTSMAEQARVAAKTLRFPGRPRVGETGEQRTARFDEVKRNVGRMRELIQLWVETPFTDEQDPASGKHHTERDAGDSDAEIEERLEYILGLNSDFAVPGQFIEASTKSRQDARRTRRGQTKLAAARTSLEGALERFYQAMYGEASGIGPARLRALLAAVRLAWIEMIRAELPAMFRASVAEAAN